MARLPQQLDWDQAQNKWASQIDPVINNPSNNVIILKDVLLSAGVNTINHKLGRKLQGWRIVRKRAAAEIYDDQDTNQLATLTLVLVSDARVVVDLEVF